ncbi:unnamed protein product [Rotaria sp. Silwood1]|nr:unnamed protein product [Rotaria sp. Silwood1]CAF4693894.1 unnamed protein product [Rotaria sp. Silwood1]
MHLKCNRGPSPLCLDWREICDGRIDCFEDGIDEVNCIELEMNECEKNEYRCQNGMCVPEQFLNDSPQNPDCLDSTDEKDEELVTGNDVAADDCAKDPAFRCEESHHSHILRNFVCGDGQEPHFRLFDQLMRLFRTCLFVDVSGNETHCRHSSLFHCPGTSKCISKYRLLDGIDDCYGGADEKYEDSCNLNQTHRFRCTSENKCISPILVRDGIKHCKHGEDEILSSRKKISFQNLCNGYVHLLPELGDEQNETDETNCEQWPCNNQYTRCDGAWTCKNGTDELNCNQFSKCYPNHHECVSPTTLKVICLPVDEAGDGKIDCFGATDEREHCRQMQSHDFAPYRCWNDTLCVMGECFGNLACPNEGNPSTFSACTKDPEIETVLTNLMADKILKECENGGQCVQDHSICPSTTMCICPECYYGGKCQFTTKGFSLSLDVILAYQIRPHIYISRQRVIINMSIAIISVILVINLISNVLSLMTFWSKNLRAVGCGLYLFILSSLSILSVIILTLKLWILILSQMSLIANRTILWINCISMEFLLQSLLAIRDWLTACVAIERVFIITKGVNFSKKKSKQTAQWIVITVVIFTMISRIYDPIHRKLIDDKEEQRTWCVVRYSPLMRIFDSAVHIFHFIIPSSINLLSAIMIIVSVARTHSNARRQQTYRQNLKKQLHHQKHLIISPIINVILSIPRLIISFLSGCMKSNRDPQLFLFGYFISFLPLSLTLIVFILPSEPYKKQFDIVIKQKKQFIRRCWHLS